MLARLGRLVVRQVGRQAESLSSKSNEKVTFTYSADFQKKHFVEKHTSPLNICSSFAEGT
jgi:hypothetical protein